MSQRELPDNFKFLIAATAFPIAIAVLVYGSIWAFGVKIDHGNMALLLIPLFVAVLGWVVAISKLPGAMAAWKNFPWLRNSRTLAILLLGWVMALLPVAVCLAIFAF